LGRKKLVTLSLDRDLVEILKARRLNVSRLVNDLLWGYLSSPSAETSQLRARLEAKKREEASLVEEVQRLQARLEGCRAEISRLESELKMQEEKAENLEWRLKVLRKFLAENSPHYEDSLRLHAEELGMEVEELRRLVEQT